MSFSGTSSLTCHPNLCGVNGANHLSHAAPHLQTFIRCSIGDVPISYSIISGSSCILVAWQLVVLATTLGVVLVLEHVGHDLKLVVLQIDFPWHASSQVDFLELLPSLSEDYGDVLVGAHNGGLAKLDVQGVAEDLKQGGHQGLVFEFDRPREGGLMFWGKCSPPPLRTSASGRGLCLCSSYRTPPHSCLRRGYKAVVYLKSLPSSITIILKLPIMKESKRERVYNLEIMMF